VTRIFIGLLTLLFSLSGPAMACKKGQVIYLPLAQKGDGTMFAL